MSGSSVESKDSEKRFRFVIFVYLPLILASVLYCIPLFSNLDCYGRRDWDQSLFRAETPRIALLRDRQLPLWNPYVNGGTVLLAHPHSPAASPWYLIVLLLGAPLGLRVQVLVFVVLGSTGMARLLRHQGLIPAACLVAGIIFMMSSHFALHIAEGHLEWCVLGLMPWLILLLYKSPPTAARTVIAALLLSSVLLFGSVYIMAVFVPIFTVWSMMECVRRRSSELLFCWIAVLVLTSLLSAVKLLPQLEFTTQNPRQTIPEGFPLRGLPLVLLDPRQALLYQATRDVLVPEEYGSLRAVPPEQAIPIHNHLQQLGFEWAWHEYGCYITYLGLVLVLGGLVSGWKKHWPLYSSGVVALLISLGNGLPLDVWALMQQLPLYESLHVPSRFLAAVVFVLAFTAGVGMDAIVRRFSGGWRYWPQLLLKGSVPFVIWLELTALGWRLFEDAFVICTPESAVTMTRSQPASSPFAMFNPAARYFPVMTSDVYPHLMANRGIPGGYENMAVKRGRVRLSDDPSSPVLAWIEGDPGTAEVRDWTMSRVTVSVDANRKSRLVLNQNHTAGWNVRISDALGERRERAEASEGGLVSAEIGPYDRVVEFYYLPRSVIWGAVISSTTLLLGCSIIVRADRHHSPGSLSSERSKLTAT